MRVRHDIVSKRNACRGKFFFSRYFNGCLSNRSLRKPYKYSCRRCIHIYNQPCSPSKLIWLAIFFKSSLASRHTRFPIHKNHENGPRYTSGSNIFQSETPSPRRTWGKILTFHDSRRVDRRLRNANKHRRTLAHKNVKKSFNLDNVAKEYVWFIFSF